MRAIKPIKPIPPATATDAPAKQTAINNNLRRSFSTFTQGQLL